jgi:hypothetical protein
MQSPEAKKAPFIMRAIRFPFRSVSRLFNRLQRPENDCPLQHGYLQEIGWNRTQIDRQAVDANGAPIPWITYPALHFLQQRIRKEWTVFEYGAGNSTLWWAGKVRHVYSCEHDNQWYKLLIQRLPGNATVRFHELDNGLEYAKSIREHNLRYDVIVIDGRDRINCARHAVDCLNDQGVIIWDNSERPEDAEGYKLLNQFGMRQIDFKGIGPINSYAWQTSIFYRSRNCLDL